MVHQGSCHCGRIAFEVEADITQVMQCNCSHCSRKGYLLAFLPKQQVRLTTPESNLSTYLFNKHVIRHHFCGRCGCAPIASGKDRAGNDTVAVNVRCLPDFDLANVTVVQVDGRSL
jgi:hypothetical protein